jgi:putative colanic acid biosynthesis UDP-glucose lipid carrier transferase
MIPGPKCEMRARESSWARKVRHRGSGCLHLTAVSSSVCLPCTAMVNSWRGLFIVLANGVQTARGGMSPFQVFLKRGFDIVGATTGLVLLSPLIALVSLAIKLNSPGPVLSRLTYYDLDDAVFEAFEFRCWSSASEENLSHHVTNTDRDITLSGQSLRRSGLDKVPLLINVLRGDMSLVGPRPFEVPSGVTYRTRIAPALLHNVKPGLISWSRDNCGEITRIEDDCYYLANRSILLDAKILVLELLLKSVQR